MANPSSNHNGRNPECRTDLVMTLTEEGEIEIDGETLYQSCKESISVEVKLAADSPQCEMRRVRNYRMFEEIRICEKPAFGMRLSADVSLENLQCERVIPGDIENSTVGEEAIDLMNSDEETTGFAEALPDHEVEILSAQLAMGVKASQESVKESLTTFGSCTELYQFGDEGIATFEAYF